MTTSARMRALGVPTALLVGASLMLAPVAATAEDEPQLEQLDEFNPADYVAEAAELPAELVEALARDVALTPEQYLAESAAAVQAVEVVASITEAGVGVLGSRMEGTSLIVNVSTGEEAAVVESTGAIAEFGEPVKTWNADDFDIHPAGDLYDGQGWVWSDTEYLYQCSVGFTGYLISTGAKQLATAGHCTDDMSGNARVYNQTAPGQGGTPGETIGAKVAGSTTFGGGIDVGRIAVGGGVTQKASALTWGWGTGAPLSSTPRAVTGDAAPIAGAALCKSGSRTGWGCGLIDVVDETVSVGGILVRSVIANLCVLPGDSGGVGLVGGKAVGITSWTTADIEQGGNSCADPLNEQWAGFFQMVSPGGHESVASTYSGVWEMAATVSVPTITSISQSGGKDTQINGTVPNAGRNYKVDVFINGSGSAFATVTVNASSGNWSVNVTSLPSGVHSFSAVARYGTWSKSSAATGFINRANVSRIQGPDRFAVGVEIAKAAYPSGGAPVIYITTGLNYPDALSAAPAAALEDGLLMLTNNTSLPTNVRNEIIRQAPDKIVVVGGTSSVSTSVYNALAAIQPNIERLGGADRFAASRNIVRDAFLSVQPSTAYIATGYNFPDALSASGAGGAFGYPVILVPGTSSTLDSATIDLLEDLGVTQIKIAGGPASVSSGILNALKVIDPTPTRLSGADRFEASTNIAVDAFGSIDPDSAFLATGLNFPDALAGAPLAGMNSAPLIVVQTNCVPSPTLNAFRDFGTTSVTLLGGPASLTTNVQALRSC